MRGYGVDGKVLEWIAGFLKHRIQPIREPGTEVPPYDQKHIGQGEIKIGQKSNNIGHYEIAWHSVFGYAMVI